MGVDKAYLTSVTGIIKLAICLSLIITLICASINCREYRIFFLLVSIFGFLFEFAFYICYLFNLIGRFKFNVSLIDFSVSVCMACLSLINFAVACAKATGNPQDGASAFFWLVLLLLTSVDSYFAYRDWRGGRHAPAHATNAGPSFVSQPAQSTANASYPNFSEDNVRSYDYQN